MDKFKSFTDLRVWQEGHLLVLLCYKITNKFPDEEKYNLISQIRRSAVSITSNISEGYGRYTYPDKIRFYYHSLGSINELKNQIIIANSLNYINKEDLNKIIEKTTLVHKLLFGFIRKSKQL